MKDKEPGKEILYIFAEYLSTKPLARQKAYGYVFADIMTKVSHLVPIVFLSEPDEEHVSKGSAGTFTRTRIGSSPWKPKSIGVVIKETLERTCSVLLHEVGHFVYMNYSKSSLERFNLNDETSSAEALADIFVIDYIDSMPLWVQAALSSRRRAGVELIKEEYNIILEHIDFDGKEVYNNLEENGLLHLLKKEDNART